MKTTLTLLASVCLGFTIPAQDPPKSATGAKVEQGQEAKKKATAKQGAAGKAKQGQAKQGQVKQGQGKQKPDKTGKPKTDKPKTDKPTTDKPKPTTDPKTEPKIDKPAGDQPIPTGTDPADLAAIASAEKMLEAERKLAKMIRDGKITGLDILPFDELTAWPYEDGLKGMPKRVKELTGKPVLMTGFMLPIDEVQNIKEFLLVQSLWSCCYGQPPDINGIVRCVMPKGKTTDYFFDPLKITGKFKVEATVMDGYCVDIYQLHVDSLEAIR